MKRLLIENGEILNEGERYVGYLLIEGDRIVEVGRGVFAGEFLGERIDAAGKWVMPGVIDCHVHFREPGLTEKGDIASESAAAVAGGVTSVMEMPNTQPPATTIELLEQKYAIASRTSLVNYSFFLGATNRNLDQIGRIDPQRICGVKLFMGSSTGDMLVDDRSAIASLFAETPVPVVAHCEDEQTIRENSARFRASYGDSAEASIHPFVRSAEACYRSTAAAVELAARYGTRLHVAHLTTARELELFDKGPVRNKKITAEACIAHLWFSDDDYSRLGNLIKCNPAVKTAADRDALREAVVSGRIDLVATDHAPHTEAEKHRPYWSAPSGMPMIRHSLQAMLQLASRGLFTPEMVVEKMCHAPAAAFAIRDRGYLRKGYRADVAVVDPKTSERVTRENIYYKCGWSPMEGECFGSTVCMTIVNGKIVFREGRFASGIYGERLEFDR